MQDHISSDKREKREHSRGGEKNPRKFKTKQSEKNLEATLCGENPRASSRRRLDEAFSEGKVGEWAHWSGINWRKKEDPSIIGPIAVNPIVADSGLVSFRSMWTSCCFHPFAIHWFLIFDMKLFRLQLGKEGNRFLGWEENLVFERDETIIYSVFRKRWFFPGFHVDVYYDFAV